MMMMIFDIHYQRLEGGIIIIIIISIGLSDYHYLVHHLMKVNISSQRWIDDEEDDDEDDDEQDDRSIVFQSIFTTADTLLLMLLSQFDDFS